MNKYLPAYLAATLVMVTLDMLWLHGAAKPMYQQAIGHLMTDQPNVFAAMVFYALYAVGLLLFAVLPHAEAPSWGRTLFMGALFGFFAYVTCDLSNLATVNIWTVRLPWVDMAWNAVLSGVSAGAGKVAMGLTSNMENSHSNAPS